MCSRTCFMLSSKSPSLLRKEMTLYHLLSLVKPSLTTLYSQPGGRCSSDCQPSKPSLSFMAAMSAWLQPCLRRCCSAFTLLMYCRPSGRRMYSRPLDPAEVRTFQPAGTDSLASQSSRLLAVSLLRLT